jgi:hypothetical protein
MDIYTLYHNCFTDSDKRNIARWLKKEKIKASNEMLLKDWIETVEISVRLTNAIKHRFCDNDIYPSQITKEMFLMTRSVGIKTWKEFQEVRGDNI